MRRILPVIAVLPTFGPDLRAGLGEACKPYAGGWPGHPVPARREGPMIFCHILCWDKATTPCWRLTRAISPGKIALQWLEG